MQGGLSVLALGCCRSPTLALGTCHGCVWGEQGGKHLQALQALQQLHDDGKSPGQSTFSAFSRPNLRSLCYTPDELIVNLPRQATKWPLSIPSSLILDQASEEHRLTAVARIRLGRCELRRWKMRTDDRSQLWPLQRNVQIVFQAAVFKRTRREPS